MLKFSTFSAPKCFQVWCFLHWFKICTFSGPKIASVSGLQNFSVFSGPTKFWKCLVFLLFLMIFKNRPKFQRKFWHFPPSATPKILILDSVDSKKNNNFEYVPCFSDLLQFDQNFQNYFHKFLHYNSTPLKTNHSHIFLCQNNTSDFPLFHLIFCLHSTLHLWHTMTYFCLR